MDRHSVIGLVPRESGHRYGKVQEDGDEAVLRTTAPGTGPGPRPSPPSGSSSGYRNYHGHKYSNKNWNHQQDRLATGAQPISQTLSQAAVHPQSDLAKTPQQPQLDPSQSHWLRRWQQTELRLDLQGDEERGGEQQGQHGGGQHQQQQHYQQRTQNQQHAADPVSVSSYAHGIHPHSRLHHLSVQSPAPAPSQAQAQAHSHTHTHPLNNNHHQPYHQRYASEPPRLPPLAASLSSLSLIPTSPFDPFHTRDGDPNYFLSFGASPSPATPSNATAASSLPRLPAHPDDIHVVSPISETSSSTPVFRSLDRRSEFGAQSPATAQTSPPFTARTAALKRQPTADSSTHASVLDDRDFELTLGVTGKAEHRDAPVSHFATAAITSAVAQDVAHLTDERSDDWFRFTARESTNSTRTWSISKGYPDMTAAMSAHGSDFQDHQQQQQQQPQGQQFTSVSSSSSFTPLPPIRRTSTFDVLRKKGLVDYDSDTMPSPIGTDGSDMPPGPADPVQHQSTNGQVSAFHGASSSSPHTSVQHSQPQPQPQPPMQHHPDMNYPAQGQSPMPQHPQGFTAAGPGGPAPGMVQYPIMQMHPHQMAMGRGSASQQAPPPPPGQMLVNGQGQPIFTLPGGGGGRWTVQESHLAEPLNQPNRNRPPNPRTYSALDKEMGEGSPPLSNGGSSQPPVQTRPRNSSNSAPPTAATRFPSLFPHPGAEQQPPFARNPGQVPMSQQHVMHRPNAGPRDSFDDKSLSKEMDVRVNRISVASTAAEDLNDKPRRSSGNLFTLGHKRNSSSTTAAQQVPSDGAPEKKKNFFASVANMAHSQPKPKSNLSPAKPAPPAQSDQVPAQPQGDHGPGKKKLSELKGMIKGVGNAKEGAKDDQPFSVETIYQSRESMQSPPRNFTAPQGDQSAPGQQISHGQTPPFGPFGPQAQTQVPGPQPSVQVQPPQMRPPGAMSPPPFMNVGRASTSGPQPTQNQQANGDDGGKKISAGGLFGGLFGKHGNKTKDTKPQPQQMPPSNLRPPQPQIQPGYLPFRPGQMQLPGQQLGPHPMLAGQPPIQRMPPGQSPSPTLFHDPTLPSPSVQTAQAVTIRRPSEITVSSQSGIHPPQNQRPGMGSPRASSGVFGKQASPTSVGQRPGQQGLQNDAVSIQTSPQLSEDSPLEGPAMGKLSAIPRASPNRKPVGGVNPRGDAHFMTSAVPPAVLRSPDSPSPSPGLGQQRAPSQLSHIQQSPHVESAGGFNDMRQPSLPSPAPSQSNQSTSSGLPNGGFPRDSPDPREFRQGPAGLANGHGPPGQMNPPGQGGAPNGLAWGPNGNRPAVPALISPSAAARAQPSNVPNSPVPSMDQGKLSKFFGAYDGGKPAAQPQANKEKSAASKFLGAFKRSSKQNDAAQQQQERPLTSPRTSQQGGPGSGPVMGTLSPTGMPTASGVPPRQPQMPAQPAQGRGSLPTQMLAQQAQGGRGQPGQIPPQGMPMFQQAGRGQIPPGMMAQGGRGQMPPQMFPGAGPIPPNMQRPATTGKQGNERQYDQVPIPRGYEAVHGYGGGGMLAFSPYNAGRPGPPPPIQYAQYPPGLPPGFPQQGQWDPRMMQQHAAAGSPPGAVPGASQMISQGVPGNIPYQGVPQNRQLASPTQIPSPTPQGPQSIPNQRQQQQQQQQQPMGFPQPHQMHQPNQLAPPSAQGQIPTQPAQINAQLEQSRQSQEQGLRREPSPDSKPQPYSWSGTPQNARSPAASIHQTNNPPPNNSNSSGVVVPQQQQISARAVSSSDSPGSSNRTSTPQSLNTTATAPSQQPSQATLPSQTAASSPPGVNYSVAAAPPAAQSTGSPSYEQQQQSYASSLRTATTSPSHASTPTPGDVGVGGGGVGVSSGVSNGNGGGLLRSQDVARLTSRMSVSQQKPIAHSEASLSPDKPVAAADRTLTVSPEPSGPRQHGSISHQVSEQNLSVNVDRANSHGRYGSDDIYDATPRLDGSSATPRPAQGDEGVQHENTSARYPSSEEKGQVVTNGAAIGAGTGAGVGLGVIAARGTAAAAPPTVVTEDNMSFLDGPDSDPEPIPDENQEEPGGVATAGTSTAGEEEGKFDNNNNKMEVSPPQQPAQINVVEPEEKILVDLPVELAAVNDLDDGIPMMSATSYPGQEWNPYGAGEFGDWE